MKRWHRDEVLKNFKVNRGKLLKNLKSIPDIKKLKDVFLIGNCTKLVDRHRSHPQILLDPAYVYRKFVEKIVKEVRSVCILVYGMVSSEHQDQNCNYDFFMLRKLNNLQSFRLICD